MRGRQEKNRCAYPDCHKPFDHWHHCERYAEGGAAKSVVPLCEIHHRFAHHCLIKNEDLEPDRWELEALSLRAAWSWGCWVSEVFGEA